MGLIAVVVVGALLSLLIHEAGHAGAARIAGGRVVAVRRVGWGMRVVADVPPARWPWFLLGGPAANLVAAALSAALLDGDVAVVWAGLHVAFAALSLWPSGGAAPSDGRRLLAWWRGQEVP